MGKFSHRLHSRYLDSMMWHDNYWNIGEFCYRFSYLEELIHQYAESFGNEYKKRKELLFPGSKSPSPTDKLKICSEIHKDQDMNDNFKGAFEKLRNDMIALHEDRKIISHGMWCISGSIVTKSFEEGKDPHFLNEELLVRNQDCLEWIREFEDIAGIKLQELIEEKGLQYYEKYIFYLGKFIVEFSQLEFNIRNCKLDLYDEYNDGKYNEISNGYASSLIRKFSKLIEKDRFEHGQYKEMKSQFFKLNNARNEIIHECFKLKVPLKELMYNCDFLNTLKDQFLSLLLTMERFVTKKA